MLRPRRKHAYRSVVRAAARRFVCTTRVIAARPTDRTVRVSVRTATGFPLSRGQFCHLRARGTVLDGVDFANARIGAGGRSFHRSRSQFKRSAPLCRAMLVEGSRENHAERQRESGGDPQRRFAGQFAGAVSAFPLRLQEFTRNYYRWWNLRLLPLQVGVDSQEAEFPWVQCTRRTRPQPQTRMMM